MSRKLIMGGALTVALLAATGLAYGVGSSSVQVSLDPIASTVAPGGTLMYTARFGCVSSVADCSGSVLTIDIPAPFTIAQFSPSGGFVATSSSSGNRVTLTLVDPLSAGASGAATVSVYAPTCIPASSPLPGALIASASLTAASATTATVSAAPVTIPGIAACVTSSFVRPLEKWGASTGVNGLGYWGMYMPPRLAAYTVEDVLPAGLTMHNVGADAGLALSVDCGAGYVPLSWDLQSEAPSPTGCDPGSQDLVEARYPNATRFKIDVPANTDGYAWAKTYVNGTVAPGGTITNCVNYIAGASGSSCSAVDIYYAAALPDTLSYVIGAPNIALGPPSPAQDWLDPGPISPTPATPMGQRDVAFSIRAYNNTQSGGDLVDPVITELLDPNLDYVAGVGGNWWKSYVVVSSWLPVPAAYDPRLQPGCANPVFELYPNAVAGRTLMRWTFKGCTLHGGWDVDAGLGVYVSARMKPSVVAGVTVSAESTTSPFDPIAGVGIYNTNWCDHSLTDTADRDGDGFTNDELCGGNVASWTMPKGTEAISATAFVQGALDAVPTRYPASGTTNLSGAATYQFVLTNSGTSPLVRLDLVDVLPSIGDSTVASPGVARGSEWGEELVAVDNVERGTSSGVYTNVPAAEFTVGSSSSPNPCRFDASSGDQVKVSGGAFAAMASVTGPTGCATNSWTAPTAGAVGWALLYQPVTPLAAGETIRVTVRAQLKGPIPPVSVVPPSSWNSIAYTATLADAGGPFELLTGEPMKVGVRFADPAATAKLGGTVWNDLNQNGIMDDGANRGLPGIGIAVQDAAGAVVTTVYTDANGVYEVAGLTPSASYRLSASLDPGFGSLDGYYVAPANAGTTPSLNCHFTQSGRSASLTTLTGAGGTTNPLNNLGAAKVRAPT
jgi:hypothetical protein